MCRLSLMTSEEPINELGSYLFSLLVFVSQGEGNTDGTGVFFNKGDEIKHTKKSIPALDFVYGPEWNVLLGEAVQNNIHALYGHTRLASAEFRQKIGVYHKDEDAHPHTAGNFIIMHNGKFDEYKRMALEISTPTEGKTDSAIFAEYLAFKIGDKIITPIKIREVLESCGICEYSLIIGQNGCPKTYIVRGSRELYQLSWGPRVFISTKRETLDTMVAIAYFHLKTTKWEGSLPNPEIPKLLPMWDIWEVTPQGKINKALDITSISSTNAKTMFGGIAAIRTGYGWEDDDSDVFLKADAQSNTKNYKAVQTQFPATKVTFKETQNLILIAEKLAMTWRSSNLSLGEFDELFKTLFNKETWCSTLAEAWQIFLFMCSMWKKGVITKEKIEIWESWIETISEWEECSGTDDVQSVYEMTALCDGTNFQFPYWLNDLTLIKEIIGEKVNVDDFNTICRPDEDC